MTPGQAADVLSAIPHSTAEDILEAMNPDSAKKVRSIMEKQEETVIHYATQKFLKFLPETLVEYVQNDYPNHARGKDVIMYIYVTDATDHLLGVVDLKELLTADDKAPLSAIMSENVISLNAESTLKDASQEFERYGFRAIPVTDNDNHLVGVILVPRCHEPHSPLPRIGGSHQAFFLEYTSSGTVPDNCKRP